MTEPGPAVQSVLRESPGDQSPGAATGRVMVTVVMPTLNEAAGIARTLAALHWADEVIVVDGGSTDDTVEIARRRGARVLVVPGVTIGAQRNAGIAAARHRWVLALDADEEATPELRRSLEALSRSDRASHSAFRIRSRNWHLGRELKHGPWGRDWKVRVFSRERRYGDQRVHEHLEPGGDVGTLDGTLLHRPYRDLAHQVAKIAQYARWSAEDMRASGKRGRLRDLLFRPPWRFLRDYVLYSGWRDGAAGFVLAVVGAFSVFLKYACLLTAGGER
jgi:glycosyltransferase involved in cell wall biosynthesis